MSHAEIMTPNTQEYLLKQAAEMREQLARRAKDQELAALAKELKSLPHNEMMERLLEAGTEILNIAHGLEPFNKKPFMLLQAFEVLSEEASRQTQEI